MRVFDNVDNELIVPSPMGLAREDQLVGTPLENLAELAGRVCYDSLGQGRTSEDYHEHILEVGHLSVYEHCVFTVHVCKPLEDYAVDLLNRPGVWVKPLMNGFRLTINLRAVLEFAKHGPDRSAAGADLYVALLHVGADLAPRVVKRPSRSPLPTVAILSEPELPQEKYISFYLSGSRGFSHEMVRHGDWTAVSQRSTRYVDESKCSMRWHPELLKKPLVRGPKVRSTLDSVERHTKAGYERIVSTLVADGVSRKQARGAARGVLPHALQTEMIFTASVAQWKWIIESRVSEHADAEINDIINAVSNAII